MDGNSIITQVAQDSKATQIKYEDSSDNDNLANPFRNVTISQNTSK